VNGRNSSTSNMVLVDNNLAAVDGDARYSNMLPKVPYAENRTA